MDLSHPVRSIIPTLDAQVITILARVTQPMTGREISRLAEAKSHTGIRLALERLREQGVVDMKRVASANLYSLNRDHVTFTAIKALTDLRGELFRRMTEAVGQWEIPPNSVSVYGSAARGDGGVRSDIDVLIIPPDQLFQDLDQNSTTFELHSFQDKWTSQVADFTNLVERWSGNIVSIIQLSGRQVDEMISAKDPFIYSVIQDSRNIWGEKI